MECEFEEKQYEQLMNYELAEKGQIYPAGQCLEKDLGIDAALFFSQNARFWKQWNSSNTFNKKPGVKLGTELWEIAEQKLRSGKFPKFKCNLFLQYKRPESIQSPNGKEYSYWNEPYLRYSIKEHQQETLCALERKTVPNALVVYACATFGGIDDLWRHAERNTLVQNSNFVQPHNLIGHHRYTFVHDKEGGHARSEPAKIEGINLLYEMGNLLQKHTNFIDNVQFILHLSKNIEMTIESLDQKPNRWFYKIKDAIKYSEHQLARSFATIFAFNLFANTAWGIGYEFERSAFSRKNETTNGRMSGFIDSL